jgi:hypothetical protein
MLLAMKAEHEARIEAVTGIDRERRSHVVLYGARIGAHDYPVRFDFAKAGMLPEHFPAEARAIDLDLARLEFDDSEQRYWDIQRENLRRQFDSKVKDRLRAGEIGHVSLFALAPQPLLVELGQLFSDIAGVTVHQLHREPQGWDWRSARPPLEFITHESAPPRGAVALNLSLSGTITDDRITAVLGENAAIWSLTVVQPHNDLMHRADDLAAFRRALRGLLDRIKARHGERAVVHVFPALPVSAAIELGRIWMPKADLPLVIYDQRRETGFVPRIGIGTELTQAKKEAAHV